MKKMMIASVLFSSISAQANIVADIQKAAKRFELPKTGSGSYIKNGVNVSNAKDCYIAINQIDAFDITALNFEFTVGTKQMGADIEGWDVNNATQVIVRAYQEFQINFNTADNCIATQSLRFSMSQVKFSQTKKCSNPSKNRSEEMVCIY